MSENMNIWNKLKRPPETALKKITGGRLNGMTDIKPQWRYEAMTELFGPCGVGWKYTDDKKWIEEGSDGQKCAFVDISLYIKHNGEWSEAIPGTGGSMLVTKEKAGLHTSDEAFKMATTDALGVAMSRIGVAADIYMGNWTGSNYKDEAPKESEKSPDEIFKEKFYKAKEALGKETFFEICTAWKIEFPNDLKEIDREAFLADCRKQLTKEKK